MGLVDPDKLDDARRLMYDDIADTVGEDAVQENLDSAVINLIERMYDTDDSDLLNQMVQAGYISPEEDESPGED